MCSPCAVLQGCASQPRQGTATHSTGQHASQAGMSVCACACMCGPDDMLALLCCCCACADATCLCWQALRLRQSWTGLAKSKSCALECIPYAPPAGAAVDTSVQWYARRARGCCSHLQALAAYQHDCRAQDHQRNLSPQQWEQVGVGPQRALPGKLSTVAPRRCCTFANRPAHSCS